MLITIKSYHGNLMVKLVRDQIQEYVTHNNKTSMNDIQITFKKNMINNNE